MEIRYAQSLATSTRINHGFQTLYLTTSHFSDYKIYQKVAGTLRTTVQSPYHHGLMSSETYNKVTFAANYDVQFDASGGTVGSLDTVITLLSPDGESRTISVNGQTGDVTLN